MLVPTVGVELADTPFVVLCPDDTDEVGIAIVRDQGVVPQKSSHPCQGFIEQQPVVWARCSTVPATAMMDYVLTVREKNCRSVLTPAGCEIS